MKTFIKNMLIRFFFLRKGKGKTKKALLSFIFHPYLMKKKTHPNKIELLSIVTILNNLGYTVTIVDYRRKKIFGKYDLVIGFGDCYEYAISKDIGEKYILYSTGSPPYYQNQNSILALRRFTKANPHMLLKCPEKYIRLTENIWNKQLISSECIITIGNDYIKKLFESFHNNVLNIPSTCFDTKNNNQIELNEGHHKNSFLWFGGKGSIHKGLDICIDAVINTKHTLYIAGDLDNEISIYKEKINNNKNIIYIGFIDIFSDHLKLLSKKISFCILPSCSEAMATSVVTLAYNFGFIPLISKECGFDLNDPIIPINELSVFDVKKAMEYASNLSLNEIIIKRKKIITDFRENHSTDIFFNKLNYCIKKAINGNYI
ncbi:hypothetical protein [Providencia manganoxydans]|uniref:hypothetical protein n=1 Tax=Providencia manganoxydans TaxID=2923283 RepID=UPI0034E42E5A